MVEVPTSEKVTACLAFYLPDLSYATQSLSFLPRDRDTLLQVQATGLNSIATNLAQVLRVRYHRDPLVLTDSAADSELDNPQLPQLMETVEILIHITTSPFPQSVDTEAHQTLCKLAAAHNQLGILLMVGGEPCPASTQAEGEANVLFLEADSTAALSDQAARAIIDLLTYSRLLARTQRWLNQYKPPYLLLNQRDMKAVQAWQQTLATSACQFIVQLTDLQKEFLSASQQALTAQIVQARQPDPPEVFISYSRRDTSVVKKLHRLLIHKGVKLWVDWENIPVAADWWAEIEEALETVHTVLFVISKWSTQSKYCRQEIDVAHRLQKRIVPVLLTDDIEDQTIHPYVQRHHRLDFFRHGTMEAMVEQLYQTIQTDLDHVKFHTRLYNQAAEWQKDGQPKDLLLTGRFLARAQAWLNISNQLNKEPPPTRLHEHYIRESERRIKSLKMGIFASAVVFIGAGLSYVTFISLRSEVLSSLSAISNREQQGVAALVEAIYVGQEVKRKEVLFPISKPIFRGVSTSVLQREINNLREQTRLEGHEGTVYKVLFPGDVGTLISAGADSSIRVWPLKRDENLPEPLLLDDHEKDVVAIDVSSDGQLLASGSYDGQVLLWDVRKNELQKELRQKSDQRIFALAFNSMGNALAASGEDGKVYLWQRANDFTEPKILPHEGGAVYSISFDQGGERLATADITGKIKLWSPEGNQIQTLDHGKLVLSMVFTGDGQKLVSGGIEGSIKVWDLTTGEETVLTGPQGNINQLAFNYEKLLLAAASHDNTVTVWRYSPENQSFQLLKTLNAHTAPVFRVEFDSDGRFLVTGGAGGQLNLWGIGGIGEQINFLYALQGHTNDVLGLDFNAGSTELASSSRDGSIRIWNLQETYPSLYHENDVLDVVFNPGSGDIITTGVRTIRRWVGDPYTSKKLEELSGNIFTADYSPDGTYLITGTDTGQLRLFKETELGNKEGGVLINKAPKFDEQQAQIHQQGVALVRFRPSGEGADKSKIPVFASIGNGEKTVYIWDINGNLIGKLKHQHPIETFSWSRDGAYLVTSSQPPDADSKRNKSMIQVWQVSSTSAGVLQFNAVDDPWEVGQSVVGVKFNPASTEYELLIVKENGVPEVWTLQGKYKSKFKDSIHSNSKIVSADVNATGSLLATLDNSGYMTLWNIRKRTSLFTSQLHNGSGWSLRFHPADSYQLATGGVDDRAVIVNLPDEVETKALELVLSQACELAKDYLQVGSIQVTQSHHLRPGQLQAARAFCADQKLEN